MALGTAVHDSECKPDNKNVALESDNKKITEEQEPSAGSYLVIKAAMVPQGVGVLLK